MNPKNVRSLSSENVTNSIDTKDFAVIKKIRDKVKRYSSINHQRVFFIF